MYEIKTTVSYIMFVLYILPEIIVMFSVDPTILLRWKIHSKAINT